jgi:hypothetical protein
VGIGEKEILANEEARAGPSAKAAGVPRGAIIHDLGGDLNADDGSVNAQGLILGAQGGEGKEKEGEEKGGSGHRAKN